jgi:hypothetical protein
MRRCARGGEGGDGAIEGCGEQLYTEAVVAVLGSYTGSYTTGGGMYSSLARSLAYRRFVDEWVEEAEGALALGEAVVVDQRDDSLCVCAIRIVRTPDDTPDAPSEPSVGRLSCAPAHAVRTRGGWLDWAGL